MRVKSLLLEKKKEEEEEGAGGARVGQRRSDDSFFRCQPSVLSPDAIPGHLVAPDKGGQALSTSSARSRFRSSRRDLLLPLFGS